MGPPGTAYTRAIHTVYPTLEIKAVQVEATGQQSHVLVVNDSIIFKFPRTRRGGQQVSNEAAVLQRLRGRLPLPIPDPVYVNLDSTAVGTVFVGLAADSRPVAAARHSARTIGGGAGCDCASACAIPAGAARHHV